jgi:phosphoglycolate phosphatase
MTESPPISLVCLDLAGIVIDDSVVERAYTEAIATQGIVPGTQEYVRSMVRFDRSRGRPPAAVLREFFETDELRAQAAALAFDRSFRAAARRFDVSVPAVVADAIGKAAGSGAHVALVTVLSRSACEHLLGPLGVADLVLCADDAPRSFPWPDPVLTAMLQLGTADVHEVAVVSATEDGVLSGHRAGAGLVVGLGCGARSAEALRAVGAMHVLDSIAGFSDLLT